MDYCSGMIADSLDSLIFDLSLGSVTFCVCHKTFFHMYLYMYLDLYMYLHTFKMGVH